MGVQPVQRFPSAGGQPLGEHLGVCPGTDRQRDVHTPVAQVPVLLQRLPQEDVLPAADEQHRDLDAVQRGGKPQSVPERIVAVGVFHPGFEPRRTRAEQRPGRLTQRQRGGRPRHPSRRGELADSGPDATGVFLVGNQIAPAQEVVDRKRSGAPHRGPEVVRPHRDHGRGQLRGRIVQQRPLGETQIGQADGAEPAGEPGLFTQPRHRIGAVGGLVDHGLEHATGPERPAHALQHDVITAGGVNPGKHQRKRKPAPVWPTHSRVPTGCDVAGA